MASLLIHPGEIIGDEITELGMTASDLGEHPTFLYVIANATK
ncbi:MULTISPECIES: hypothetical protein [Nostocaceae]|nr:MULTISPECIES: hypothetical protein [Nostocaceae]